ncbi:hypothetical protein L7F22_049219 [Adiantum nelumboides]|nr:hypothetical protein [Adiantum nelumboides]
MRAVRLPVSNDADDTGQNSVSSSSPKVISNVFSGGRYRRLSLDGESIGCLSLLDAGEQVERPRAFPSSGLAGELLTSCGLKVYAQPTVHVHRPRAVLSSPENDELQGQQGEKSTVSSSAVKSLEARSMNFPTVSLSVSDSFNDSIVPSKVVPKAVMSPPDELPYMGELQTSVSDEASSCSTRSNVENCNELLFAHKPSNELVNIKLSRILSAEALKERKANIGLPPKSRHEQSGNEESLAVGTAAKRLVKKHSSLPTNSHYRSPKQPSSPRSAKKNPGKALRPWY